MRAHGKRRFSFLVLVSFLFVFFRGLSVGATEFTSDSFKIIDPTVNEGAAILTSDTYRLIGVFGNVAQGRSTITSFSINAGSQTYPVATAPVLTANPGAQLAALSWTASQGSLGWTISGYDVCQGTASNSYTCTDVGNVTTLNRGDLTAGTQYFFRIRAKDIFGNVVVRSNEATVTPTASGSGSSGGGGGSTVPTVADATLSGRAYPSATVSLLLNGAAVRQVSADATGNFSVTINALPTGQVYTFGVIARDAQGRASVLITYTVNIPSGVSQVAIANIFLPPTIALSSTIVEQGTGLNILGTAFPGSTVAIDISGAGSAQGTATAVLDGSWTFTLSTGALAAGNYSARARASISGAQSADFSAPQSFTIASVPVVAPPPSSCAGADLNRDGAVNLADISIMLTFWGQTPPSNACADLNRDGTADLIDFSIILFLWTG